MEIRVNATRPYPICIERESLGRAKEIFGIPDDSAIAVISDSGVPSCHKANLCLGLPNCVYYEFPEGEIHKNIEELQGILRFLAENTFTRDGYLITLGGGVVGDMGGFAASMYMRGIKWINVPTTLLSQVDSSIGGKTAIDFAMYKNLVGAFYDPIGVLVDTDTLKTLDNRQISAGMAEVIKMAATFNRELFEYLENTPRNRLDIEKVICESLLIKKNVVEEDPRETHLRKSLNFGHTIGHALESTSNDCLLHGEAVGLGMLLMTRGEVHDRIKGVMDKFGLPLSYEYDKTAVIEAMKRDKKNNKNGVSAVFCNEIGAFEIQNVPFGELEKIVMEGTL